ncbi:MAG: glutathione S-transferase family protein [Gluconacetobacter diazotrophicus]|nr:glutathione S-transferase family protein [Gluconacetobacter diazotrophicus]
MPVLYYAPGACSLAVHIVLEWIGVPYEAVAADRRTAEYRAINPAGAVPALRCGSGVVLTQASAILHYLARSHPAAELLDETTPEAAAENDRWSAFLTGDLHPAFFPVFTPGRYTISTDPATLDAVRAAGIALVRTKMTLLDRHLTGRTWMVGDRRSVLDAYTVPMVSWAAARLPDGLASLPAVAAHHARMLDDAVVQRVMAAENAARR